MTDILMLTAKKRLSVFVRRNGRYTRVLSAPCAVGANGITKNKREGDGMTPRGVFGLCYAFGTKPDPGTRLKYIHITDSMYFVDDINSKHYNTLVDAKNAAANFKSAEHMTDYPGLYDYGLAVDFNSACVPGLGSAIFLHCTDDVRRPTRGCVAIKKPLMLMIAKAATEKTKLIII